MLRLRVRAAGFLSSGERHILALACAGSACLSLALAQTQDAPDPVGGDWIEEAFQPEESMDIVRFMAARWRVRGGGNPGFDESVDHIRDYLREGGFERTGSLEVIEGPLTLNPLAWDPVAATLSLAGPDGAVLSTLTHNPTLLAKWSASTPAGGVTAELVDVGPGTDASHYEGVGVAGKIVLARGNLRTSFQSAVSERGAIGLVSDNLRAAELYRTHPHMVRTGNLPVASAEDLRARKTWAMKIAPQVGDALRKRLTAGKVEVTVDIRTRYFEGPQRGLVAEIRGASRPAERVALFCHLDNNAPGAHNNASGAATHAQLARILSAAIASEQIPRPARTITFLFAAEHVGSQMWLDQSKDRTHRVKAMLNGDMTGFDTVQHGGVYRLERMPDPATHSPRPMEQRHPQDRVSGWGYRPFSDDPYPGHYLTDLMWDRVLWQAGRVGWRVHQNPFEGGSDHDDFLIEGVPSTLSWYWQDPYISTNLDTPDKVDPLGMRNVAVVHGHVALTLASATSRDAHQVLALIELGMSRRLDREQATASRRIQGASKSDRERILAEERAMLELWSVWYTEAAQSVAGLSVEGADRAVDERIARLVERWRSRVREVEAELFE